MSIVTVGANISSHVSAERGRETDGTGTHEPLDDDYVVPRFRRRYSRAFAREPQTAMEHQLLFWLRLWS